MHFQPDYTEMVYQTYQPKLTKTKLRRVEQYVNSQDPSQVPEVREEQEDLTERSCELCETTC